jgi:hypothetical protein
MKKRLDNRIYESDIKDIHLLIEITDHCNCKCVMCRQSKLNSIHGNIYIAKQLLEYCQGTRKASTGIHEEGAMNAEAIVMQKRY